MKTMLKLLLLAIACTASPSHAWWSVSSSSTVETNPSNNEKAHNEWLKQRFSKQHQQLIPVVAVADMFLTCNQVRKTDKIDYEMSFLINQMDKNTLAEKLGNCLGDDTLQSDVALNFGLEGCFKQQLAHLPKTEREQKIQLVKQVISSLSQEERKKSFTQCVNDQSIHYLK
jgi:hypothetical protein